MAERKLYKTKLCVLYRRGRCSRQFCNFAHGDAELRRSFDVLVAKQQGERSMRTPKFELELDLRMDRLIRAIDEWKLRIFVQDTACPHLTNHYQRTNLVPHIRMDYAGKQEFRGAGDLRERLDRMRSPLHNSPGRRDSKSRHTSHGDSPRSLGKRIDRNPRRRHLDGHGEYSGRMSNGTEDQIQDRRLAPSEAKMQIDEQLRELHSEIKLLEDDKQQLEMYLEDKVKEADSLTFKIHELEMQLSKEKEDGKRFTTKIKKFIKAHNHQLRLQDELKRSQAQLQKLGEQLDLDVGGGNEDDPKIKATSDDVNGGFTSPLNEGQLNSSPRRKRSRVSLETQDASHQDGGRTEVGKIRVEKPPQPSRNHDHFSNSKKPEADDDTYHSRGPSAYEEKSRRGSKLPSDTNSADKYKVSETGIILPSTGIAANAIDEDVEVAETDDRFQVAVGSSNGANGREDTYKTSQLLFLPPPPPISQNAYLQYKGDDENVDVDGVDEETVEVDIV